MKVQRLLATVMLIGHVIEWTRGQPHATVPSYEVIWLLGKAKKQNIVSFSSAETEYNAMRKPSKS